LAENISDEEQKKTINHYRTIIHNISIVPVLREFEKIEEKKLKGKEIFLATESLIQKYNLEEKWEKKKELMETFDEPVHILCNMYLKGE
jgi:hypothetical protein